MLMKAPLRKKKGKREGFPEDGARCAMAAQCAVAHGTHIRVGGLYLPSLADESIRGGGGGVSMMDAFVVSGSPSHASGMAIVGVLGGRNPTLAVFPRRRGMSMNVSSTCKKK